MLWVVFKLFHRKSGRAGKRLAATGVVFGCISILVGFGQFPSVTQRTPEPTSQSAISSLRNIVTSQITYSATIGQGSFAPSLKALQDEGLIESRIGSGTKEGYRLLMTAGPPDEQGKITTFSVVASPVEYGVTGYAHFYSDESGVIRYTLEDRPAWFKDPPHGQ